MRCFQCSNIQEVMFELLSGKPGDVEEAGEPVRSFSMPCTSREGGSLEFSWGKSQLQHRQSSIRSMGAKTGTRASGRSLRKCRTNMPHSSLFPQPHAVRCSSSLQFSMGRSLNYENARAVLSPSDILYQFCVAAVSTEGDVQLPQLGLPLQFTLRSNQFP